MRHAFLVILSLALALAPAASGFVCDGGAAEASAASQPAADSCCCIDVTTCACCSHGARESEHGDSADAGHGCSCSADTPQNHGSEQSAGGRTASERSAFGPAVVQDDGRLQTVLRRAVDTPRSSVQPEVRAPLLL